MHLLNISTIFRQNGDLDSTTECEILLGLSMIN